MAYMAKSQWLVTISGISGSWDTQDGGDGSSSPIKHIRGGNRKPDLIGVPAEFSAITVSRLFGDGYLPALAALTKKIGIGRHTITKQALDANGVRKGKPITYKSCLLSGVNGIPVDSNATGEAGMMTLVFETSGPA